MLVLNRTRPSRTEVRPAARTGLRQVAVGLGSVQLLLDIGQVDSAREALRAVRRELQELRRSASSR